MKNGSTDFDFLLSIVLFSIAYASLFTFLPSITLSSTDQADFLIHESGYLSTVLIKSPGYPKNWTDITTTEKLGFGYYNTTYYPNILDYEKIESLTGVTCNSLRSKTVVDLNFSINIKADINYNCTGTIPDYARRIDRTAYTFNGTHYIPTVFQVYTW